MNKMILQGGKILAAGVLLACLMGLLVPAAYAAQPGEVTLTVKQVLTHTGALPDAAFRYQLRPKLASNPMPKGSGADGYPLSIAGTGSAQVGPIAFTQAGRYDYELTHIASPQPGFTCGQKVYRLEIYVKRGLDVTVVVYKEDGSKASEITYEHSFLPRPSDPNAMADLPVVNTVSGNPAQDSVFTFRLAAKNPSDPMPAGSADGVKTLQITGSGRGSFGTWSYTAEGAYYYTVSEVNSGVSGYTYDNTVYTITDTVKAVDGQLAVTRVVTNGAHKQVGSLSFINTYTSAADNGTGGSGGTGGDGKPGKPGPVTGDESQVTLYIALFCAAGIAALGSIAWLLANRRRRAHAGDTKKQ